MKWIITPILIAIAISVASKLLKVPAGLPFDSFVLGPRATWDVNSDICNGNSLASGFRGKNEALTRFSGNKLFTSTTNGSLVVVDPQSGKWTEWAHIAGCPLAMEFNREKTLYMADAARGLIAVHKAADDDDRGTALPTIRIASWQTTDDQQPITLADAVAIDHSTGNVYFTDATKLYPERSHNDHTCNAMRSSVLEIASQWQSGRVVRYDADTGRSDTVMRHLVFANGIAIAADGSFLVVVETGRFRVRRLWLTGPKVGQEDYLIENLPCFGDNIHRSEDGKSFWLACPRMRDALLDWALANTWLKLLRLYVRLPTNWLPKPSPFSAVLQISAETGEIIRALHDPKGECAPFVTDATELDGHLYLSSLHHSYIRKVNLSNME